MRLKRVAGLALLAMVPVACRTASIYSPDVRVRLSAAPVSVRPGEPVRLEFTLTNPQPDSLVLEFQEECRVRFMVLDEAQRVVVPSDETICMASDGGRLVLASGGTWTARGEWNGAGRGGDPIAPGSYAVRAVLGEHYSVLRGRREFKMSHAADTVAFQVVAPDAP